MRKTATTVVTTALGITMGLTLAACGGGDEKPDAGATSTSPTATTSSPGKTKAAHTKKAKPGKKSGKKSAPRGPRSFPGPGFAFQLPEGWQKTQVSDPRLLAHGAPSSSAAGQQIVLAYGDGRPPSQSLQDDGGKNAKSEDPVKIGGEPALAATADGENGTALTRYLWNFDGHRFQLTFTLAGSMSGTDRQALIDAVLKSWSTS